MDWYGEATARDGQLPPGRFGGVEFIEPVDPATDVELEGFRTGNGLSPASRKATFMGSQPPVTRQAGKEVSIKGWQDSARNRGQ